MPRYFTPSTVRELRERIDDVDTRVLLQQVKKDIKVEFDLENCERRAGSFGPKGLMGYQTLPTGLVFCGMAAGGDWEHPVFFILYLDGTELRAYIPTDGNPWNTTTKKAYGNDAVADGKNAKKRWPETFGGAEVESDDFEFDADKIREDLTNRLVLKPTKPTNKKLSIADRITSLVFYGTGDEAYELFQQTCSFCYKLNGLGMSDKAAIVCEWAEDMAKASAEEPDIDKTDFAKGYYG